MSNNPLFTIRRGNTRPKLRFVMYDDDGEIVDLTGGTATLYFGTRDKALIFSADLTPVGDPASGDVEYEWIGSDTDRAPGEYLAYAQAVLADGGTISTPNGEEIIVKITAGFSS